MMDSKDSALTPSIVISPADACLKDDLKNLYTSLAISIKQTTTTSSSGHGTYEYRKTEVRHYSSSSEPSLSPEKTAESQTSSPTLVAEDVISESDPGTNCTPSSPTAASSPTASTPAESSPAATASSPTAEASPTDQDQDAADQEQEQAQAAISRPRRGASPDVGAGRVPFEIDLAANEQPAQNENNDQGENNEQPRSASGSGWGLQALSSSPPNNTPSNSTRSAAHVGLVNQAMTCYLNSLIQALYMTPEFRNALYKWEFTGSNDEELHSIPYHLQKLFLNLQTSQRNAVETTKLTRSFGWDSSEAWNQHDIQELCRVMFEALERKFANTDQQDFIQRLYEGKMIDYVKCLECVTEKSRKDSFLDIPLPVKPFGNPVAYETIEQALDGFVLAETLDGNNQYFCETCNKKCDAQKGLKFSHFPYILTLHLKRFDFDYHTMHRIKLNDEVSFPEVLNLNDYIGASNGPTCSDTNAASAMCDLNPSCSTNGDGGSVNGCQNCNESEACCCSDTDEGIDETTKAASASKNCPVHNKVEVTRDAPGPFKYELFSIMIHSGSASGGHYFAYIKDFDTNEWFCFNDDVVSPISHEDIVENFCSKNKNRYSVGFSTTPYMLMYRQIDKEKNATFMKAEEFPDHIKKLVQVVQKEDEEQQNRRIVRRRPVRDVYNDSEQSARYFRSRNKDDEDDKPCVRVHFDQGGQEGSEKKVRWLVYTSDETFGDFLSVAADLFNLANVPLNKLRLAVYHPGEIPCVETIEADPKERIETLLSPKPSDLNLLLYVQEDAPEAGDVRVQMVSLDSSELLGLPIEVEYSSGMTIGALKEKLMSYIDGLPLNQVFIVTARDCIRKVFPDDLTVEKAVTMSPEFFAALSQTPRDQKDVEAHLTNMLLSPVVELECKFVGISRDLLTRFGQNEREIYKSEWRKKIALSNGLNGDCTSGENGWTPSSKTQEEKEDTAANVDSKPVASSDEGDQKLTNGAPLENGDSDAPDSAPFISNSQVEENRTDNNKFSVLHLDEDNPTLKLSVSSGMKLSTFKTILAQFVGLPKEYLRIYAHPKQKKEINLSSCPMTEIPSHFNVLVKKPLASNGAIYWKIHKLDPKAWLAVYLFDCAMTKSLTVIQAKEVILKEMQERGFEAVPMERCRLREVMGSRPRNVFLDSLTLRQLYSTSYDILVQDRDGPEIVENGFQNLVMVRNFDNTEEDQVKELVMDNVTSFESTSTSNADVETSSTSTSNADVETFFEKLSEETGIRVDCLDVRILCLSSAYYRKWGVEDFEHSSTLKSLKLIDNGHAFYYRDKRASIEDRERLKLWDSHMPVREYLERNSRSENESEDGEHKRSRRYKNVHRSLLRDSPPQSLQAREDGSAAAHNNAPNATNNDTDHLESSSEPAPAAARETPVKSYRSKERGLKIYVEPTPAPTPAPQRSTPEPAAAPAPAAAAPQPQQNHKPEIAVAVADESQK